MKRWMVVVVALLSACGGSTFQGTYGGSLESLLTCPDGSGSSQPFNVAWTLHQSLETVTIVTGGSCGDFSALANGNTASLDTKHCPSFTTSDGITATLTVVGGTISMVGSALSVDVQTSTAISASNGSGTCPGTWSGTLQPR